MSDLSGSFADVAGPGSVVAAQLAAEDFGGRVAGLPVQILSADHQNRADTGSAIARRWFDTEAVDAIVLGCAGMADLCDVLTPRLGVPVVDGVAAAVGLAAGMVRMGIRTSQRGEYAAPAGARKHERNPAPVTSESSRGEAAPWQTTR